MGKSLDVNPKEMNKRFQVAATLEGISTLKDGGASVRFHTQELNNDDKSILFDFANSFGHLLFSANEVKEDELKLEAIRKDTVGKSPSQRMRAVIFKLWEQNGRKGDFDTYYGTLMESLLNQLKEKLE